MFLKLSDLHSKKDVHHEHQAHLIYLLSNRAQKKSWFHDREQEGFFFNLCQFEEGSLLLSKTWLKVAVK